MIGKPAMKTTDEKGNDHFKGHALESRENCPYSFEAVKI